jgi:ABC-type sulfate transport system permease component
MLRSELVDNKERWLPFWMPFAVFGAGLAVIFGGGFILYNIAVATRETFPGLHAGGVIIAALTLSLIIGVAATVAALGGRDADAGRDGAH